MEAVLIAYALASAAFGLLRPGLICALSLHSYNYESYFDSNPIIGVALVCLIPLLGMIYAILKKEGGLHLVDILFALFSLSFLVMASRSPAPGAALEAVGKYAITCAGLYFAPRFLFAKYREYNAFTRDFAVSFVIQALVFAALAEQPPGVERTAIGEGNAFGFGVSLNIGMSLVVGYLLSRRNWRLGLAPPFDLVLLAIVLGALCYATFLNGTRSAFIGTFAAAVFLSGVLIWRRCARFAPPARLSVVLAYLGLVFGLVIGAAEMVSRLDPHVLSERMKYPVLKLANTLLLHEAYPVLDLEGSSGRSEIYADAVRMLHQAPLLGHGLGAFAGTEGDAYEIGLTGPEHAVTENLALELLAEGGIAALVLWLLWIAAVVALGLRQTREPPGLTASRVFLSLAIASLVMLQLGGTLLIAKELFFALGTLVGAEFVRARRLHRKRRRRAPAPATAPTIAADVPAQRA